MIPSTVASVVGAVFEIGKAAANRHISPPTPKIVASVQTGAGSRRRRPRKRRGSGPRSRELFVETIKTGVSDRRALPVGQPLYRSAPDGLRLSAGRSRSDVLERGGDPPHHLGGGLEVAVVDPVHRVLPALRPAPLALAEHLAPVVGEVDEDAAAVGRRSGPG